MQQFIESLKSISLAELAIWSLAINTAIFFGALAVGELLVRVFKSRACARPPEPLTTLECVLAGVCLLLNSLVFFAGAILWRSGLLAIRFELTPLSVAADVLVLFLAMDFLMYVTHRIAHHPLIFAIVHATHHRYTQPRPLTLFALNPIEVLGFGSLWLGLICLYASSWLGIVIYLTLNVVFGMVGHLGVEPFPAAWIRVPVLRWISTSTFHAEHHDDKDHNYGFYTLIWDRLFGTTSPTYDGDFSKAVRA